MIIGAVNVLIREFNDLGGALRPGFTKLREIGEIAHSTLGLVTEATERATTAARQYTSGINRTGDAFGVLSQEVAVTIPLTNAVAAATDKAAASASRGAAAALDTQTKAQQALNAAQAFIATTATRFLVWLPELEDARGSVLRCYQYR